MDSTRAGILFGLAAAAMWALYFVYTRNAVALGVSAGDLVILRYGVAAAVVLPWLLRKGLADLGGVGWGRGLALTLCIGPLFMAVAAWGFQYAPLAHGAVIQPSTTVLVATVVAVLFFGERAGRGQWVGLGVVILGLGLIGLAGGAGAEGAWRGQLLFVLAGFMGAGMTLMISVWALPGFAAIAAVSVLSFALFGPVYLALNGTELLSLARADLLTLAVVHGVLAGVAAIATYGRAVALLGASRAALFPAIVPAMALVLGIPLAGVWPAPLEWLGAGVATLGLSVAMGAVPGLKRFGL